MKIQKGGVVYYRQFEVRTRSSLKRCPANSH